MTSSLDPKAPPGVDPLTPLGYVLVNVHGHPLPGGTVFRTLAAAVASSAGRRGVGPQAVWILTPAERTRRRTLFHAGQEAEI